MAQPISIGQIDVSLTADMAEPSYRATPDIPFRILVLGDFSGRAKSDLLEDMLPSSDYHPILVDRDNVDQVITQLTVGIQLPLFTKTSQVLSLQFGELDDFHPDHLIQQNSFFSALMALRKRLTNPYLLTNQHHSLPRNY
ncbi:MAG: hypothetical protein GKS05_11440 [Nitrospirales bacterium]|nr:hypothetical protein [Nitrospirales bacterium]